MKCVKVPGHDEIFSHRHRTSDVLTQAGFGNQFIFGYEVEVELPIQLENGNEVEYE